MRGFDHIETWVFDLDETLYPQGAPLFPQIEARMTRWITGYLGVSEAEADRLRHRWWHDHGTTLAGLMLEHGADPEPFLDDVHDIDFTVLDADPRLRAQIQALPGRKIIFTNGTAPYAERVLAARGLTGLWDAVHGIEHAGFTSKPHADAYARVFARDGLTPHRAAMFEDSPRNLLVPHDLGLTTVQVGAARAEGAHIHHHTDDLTGFLRGILSPVTAPGTP
ncbi:pyrimidine 5'-nucleotidase [Jannaschia sp. M317]|uniref:pyrimidine 5'-nucleotidase n=1 Tax=Jannaschia sp. M317 TaxID=2867011 RepID=UPI0021A39D08|nr:pyrimidine 5'-nucleotidase [Jannaschia sp. M317]UWQ17211.1 pyrimidine 5'-nucleotidase [Jannaschia sp. M317]